MSASSFRPTSITETRSNISSSDAPTASNSSDPASSLRAAALLTLKSKRRKPPIDSSQGLPSRPPPPSDTGFQLDYGQEEITPLPAVPETPIISKPSISKPPEEDQIREEGEISDEEVIQPSTNLSFSSSPKQPPLPPIVTDLEVSKRFTPTIPIAPSASESLLLKPRLTDRISDPPASAFAEDTSMLVDSPFMDDLPLHLIDADHVRPRLALNQTQYDAAKDIVLDLLGWGVPPEYLVDCGLTREIIFYVFRELNLRLPQNLDTTGLFPYTPEIKNFVERHQSTTISPPIHHLRHNSQGHLSFTPKSPTRDPSPPAPQGSPALTLPTMKSVSETPHTNSSSNLHDMEQQRRQELLARKAVIASRKSKVSSVGTSGNAGSPESSHLNGQDVDMAVPTETVEDFLKSIEPKPESTPTPAQTTPPDSSIQQQKSGDTMDVDEIPGLGSNRSFSTDILFDEKRSMDISERHVMISPALSAANSVSQLEYPPSSTESSKTTFDVPLSSSEALYITDSQATQRRGTKRPVASDFVDFETAPRSHNGLNGGYSNGTASNTVSRNAFSNGFASASGMRRCVIDLSDSEGEDAEDVVMGNFSGSNGKDRRGIRNGLGSPLPTKPTIMSTGSSNRWTPPPNLTPGFSSVPLSSSGTMSPAALMEKETEIRKMRELIAQREKNRLKKAAAARSMSTIDNKGTSNTGNDPTSIPRKLPDVQSTTFSQPKAAKMEGTNEARQPSPQPINPTQQTSHIGSPSSSGTATIDTHSGDNISVDSITSIGEPVSTADVRHEQVVNKYSTQADAKPHSGNGSPFSGSVDVDPSSSSSAQVPPKTTLAHQRPDENQVPSEASLPTSLEDRHNQGYAAYDSIFRCYPLLGALSRQLFPDMTGFQASSLSLSSLPFSPTSLISFTSDSPVFPIPPTSPSFFYSPTHPSHIPAFSVPNLKSLKLAILFKKIDPSKRICKYEVPGGGVCRDDGCDDVHLDRIGLEAGELEPSDQDMSKYLMNTLPAAWLDEHGVSHSMIFSALQQVRLKNPQMTFEERVAQVLVTLGPPPLPFSTPK